MQVFSTSLILLNYRVNTSYIIENFCENTDRPELKCEGKCHLTKQLKADEEHRSEVPASLTEQISFVLSTQEIDVYEFNTLSPEELFFSSLYLEGNYSNILGSIFHPPQVA
jgi:hypothetical protein